ncbi:MAG TPA: hypothetical protein VLM89_03080 [Phycisphaerae bacterium]|nr:hypothetical protein [Phycisphaerae bacterium]
MAVYLFVLTIAVIVAMTGLTLVAVQRADLRVQMSLQRSLQAQHVAQAGIEYALGYLASQPNWRQTVPNGTWLVNMPFGPGTYTLQVADADGNPANNDTDPLTLTSTADVSGAASRIQVTIAPRPYAALGYACFSQTTFDIRTNAALWGPARAHQSLLSDGNYDTEENAFFETLKGSSVHLSLSPVRYATSTLLYPRPGRDHYLALATPITGSVGSTITLSKYVLTPTRNSESPGQVNPNGIYALNAAGRDVLIERTRIKGTLIIHNGAGRKVTVQRAVLIEPAGTSCPTMLIYTAGGEVDMNLDSSLLSESSEKIDFNEDGDQTDSFPPLIRGVVWTESSYVQIRKSATTFSGCLMAGSISVHDRATVNDDPSLAQQVMPGFVDPDMKIVSGSWKELQP